VTLRGGCRHARALRQPGADHCTIARSRQRHEAALGELFGEVLGLCAEAGLAPVGVIAIDGTKVHANTSQHGTRDYEQIAREILEEAGRVEAEEDEQFGERRGDELPPELSWSPSPVMCLTEGEQLRIPSPYGTCLRYRSLRKGAARLGSAVVLEPSGTEGPSPRLSSDSRPR
jgi:hypothetical protein